jgi:hypothetical protein
VKRRGMIFLALISALTMPSAWADAPKNVQIEVDFLLGYINVSGCQFYRNGSWYDPQEAQAHLRTKYQYLSARNQISTTEDFIEKAATKSSFSGQAYQVECKGEPTTFSNQWLSAALARFRSSHAPR